MAKSVLAYHDSFSGMLPCKVVAMRSFEGGRIELLCRYTTDRGGFKRGHEEWWNQLHIIPRAHYHKSRRGPFHHYVAPYEWRDLLT